MANIDKLYHFIAGFIITLLIGYYIPILGLVTGLVVAMLKEVYDYYKPNHTCDANDFIATVLGTTVAIIIILVEINKGL